MEEFSKYKKKWKSQRCILFKFVREVDAVLKTTSYYIEENPWINSEGMHFSMEGRISFRGLR